MVEVEEDDKAMENVKIVNELCMCDRQNMISVDIPTQYVYTDYMPVYADTIFQTQSASFSLALPDVVQSSQTQ